jgi:hypothetical protein
MAKRYQIVQERFEEGYEAPTRDEFPILFPSIDECRARVRSDGLASMFQHEGDTHYIAELKPFRDGVILTGRTFEIGPA